MTAPAATTAALTQQIEEALGALDAGRLAGLYRADALLDANVPQWRYQLQGPAAIGEQLREEWAPVVEAGARVTSLRTSPMDGGLVVETEVRFREDGEERLWRDIHVLRTDGHAIVEHTIYCSGVWDAATIARQAVEAPMVRP